MSRTDGLQRGGTIAKETLTVGDSLFDEETLLFRIEFLEINSSTTTTMSTQPSR